MLEELKREVWLAHQTLAENQLAKLTWGNVSGIDRAKGLVAIKPSGVPYSELTPEQMVVVDLEGRVAHGQLKPSSDTPTHLALYRAWPRIMGVAHSHSPFATAFAQALKPIPCFGTTHADNFYGEVHVTRMLTPEEAAADYEANTGRAILESFLGRDSSAMPAVLAAAHGPFTWGKSAGEAAANAVALEEVAKMALAQLFLNPEAAPLPQWLLDRHFFRKHGPGATYGQKEK